MSARPLEITILGAVAAAAWRISLMAAQPAASAPPASSAPAAVESKATTGPLTSDQALARVVRPPWARDKFPTREEIAEARKVLEAAATREPANSRWAYGIAHAARLDSAYATGKEAEAARKDTKERFEKLTEREPKNPEYHYWLGNSCFEMVDDVGMLSKVSLASKGRASFEKAIELDPANVSAHYALGSFYWKAPGIAGGSEAKAKAEGATLLGLPNGRGEYWGHILLAEFAAEKKDWDEMSRQYAAAETAKGEGASASVALQSHIQSLLNGKKDAAAVLPLVGRYRTVAKPEDTTADFFEGEARRQLGQWAEAVAAYEKVLAKTPEARNTRFGIAECYEKLGKRDLARKHYEEFARRFPKDDRAVKALEAVKRLS